MENNIVEVDYGANPPKITFAPVFNVAVAFIDRHVSEGRGDKVALKTEDGDVSYDALLANVNRFGNAMAGLGLKAGDRVLMVVVDEPAFFYTFWGAIKAGIIPIAVNTMLKPPDYAYLIDDCGCKAIVHSDSLTETIAEAVSVSTASPLVFATGRDGLSGHADKASADLTAAETGEDTECFWLYSSGSTGNPKGVVHAHRDMVITSERYGRGIAGIREDDTVYCASKLFFSYGFGGGMTFPLWAGSTIVVIPEKTTPELTFSVIGKFRPTVFFGVPTLYGQQLHAAEQAKPDMSSIRIALSAGEALPAHIYEQAKKNFGFTILDGIGSTEVLHIFISNRVGDVRPGTSGTPVPGYEVKIVDGEGKAVDPGQIGTLWVKGESNASMYWNNPEKTAQTMIGPWLNTGDMYYVDEDGYYVNAGRGDDMLKVGGMWCSPIEIEAHLLRHPRVREVAVVGRRDADDMMKPEAFVVLKDSSANAEETTTELVEFCKEGLARFKYPRWFNYIDELPKTTSGKIQRFKLRSSADKQA